MIWLVMIALVLAYVNGANDNVKGVATLIGSRTMRYRAAIWWASVMTWAGSLAAIGVSAGLVTVFSGKGLVPETLAQQPAFLLAVGLGTALTVALATWRGLPVSTTHAMTGALVGAGLMAAGSVNVVQLWQKFFMPLALSPLLSVALTGMVYRGFHALRRQLGVERQMCICVEGGAWQPITASQSGAVALRSTGLTVHLGSLQQCAERYHGSVFGLDAQRVVDGLHVFSAGWVSFSRGLNDTPKIVALIVAAHGVGIPVGGALALTGAVMGVGGLLHARRIATTMGERITPMNHGQGFTANLITAWLVVAASRLGLPVSTTHVSCGSLFGLGAVTGQARWAMIRTILAAWIGTLPMGACLAALTYWVIR